MDLDLPFFVEYAKTSRASCKGCKSNISQGNLRIAVMVQSAFHDGKQPNWFHKDCFFKKQRPSSIGDMANFENLRFQDQQEIEERVASVAQAVVQPSSSKKSSSKNLAIKDFAMEYAKSARAGCRGCEQKILKGQLRIRKTVYDTEVGMKYGGQALWYHLECFAQMRSELGWFDTGKNIPGYKSLTSADKEDVKKHLPVLKESDSPIAKKPKLEILDKDTENESLELGKLKEQSEKLFKFRDLVRDNMRKEEITLLLEKNKQEPVLGDSEKLLDQIADILTFGALDPCPVCNGRQLLFAKSGYLCNGNLSEWTKCNNLITYPKRTLCKIPAELGANHSFLFDVSKKPGCRIIRDVPPSASTIARNLKLKKNSDEENGPKIKRKIPPLYNLKISHIGLKDHEEDLRKRIETLGGRLDTKITEETFAVISTANEVKKGGTRMLKAKELGIHVVPKEYIDAVESKPDVAIKYLTKLSLCDWVCNPPKQFCPENVKSSKSKSIYTKSVPKSVTLKVKNGLAVDPDSGLENLANVYVKGGDKYNVVLGLTDLQRNKNSFYKLQLLKSINGNRFWIFRSWGRIGTTIGGNKLEDHDCLDSALESFKRIYFDKTGNYFENREQFLKVPGRMYPIDIEYEDEKKSILPKDINVQSKLCQPLQNLIQMIFDVDTMKNTMIEYKLDIEKMPLGKLSLKQINSAYSVLSEIYELIQKKGHNAKFIDATNRFYTLIPHNFGINKPPLLDTIEEIEKLRQMLDSLAEIEYAYTLIKNETSTDGIHPLDKHYESLNIKLEILDNKTEEFELLKKYVENTHADTHKSFQLEVKDIFKVERQGENRRYKPFKKLHNRKLLWHGSRVTNFIGILSHGLKIAPPEAPATGYMFGKGIYFADMVSKSANYCCTSQHNSTGLMILSEVALGDMLECTQAKYITKLPNGKHSTFGVGRTMPNPKESHMRADGVEIPLGKPITNSNLKSSLLYNEYIVYDIAQVKIEYLFRMEFKYKY